MKANIRAFVLSLVMLTLTVTVSQSFAKKEKDQPNADVRTDLSSSDLAIKGLFNARMDWERLVFDAIEKKSPVDYGKLLEVVAGLESASIRYFEAAGITYTPRDEYNYQFDYEGVTVPAFKYKSFLLTLTKKGDFASELLRTFDRYGYGAFKTTFVYHPTWEIRRDYALAAYHQVKKSIDFGPQVFTDRFYGIGDTLRHEIQHQIEQLRLEKGEFSLARFSFTNTRAEPGSYRTFLGLDEIETHRLDLKYLADYSRRRDKEIRRISGDPEAMLKHVNFYRSTYAKAFSERLKAMIQRSRETLQAIREAAQQNKLPEQRDLRGNRVVEFKDLRGPYPEAEVIIGKAGQPVSDVAKALIDLVTKAESKLSFLEAEVAEITPRLPILP